MEIKPKLIDNFTPEEIEELRSYIAAIKKWEAEEPPKLEPAEEVAIISFFKSTGKLLPAYEGIASVEDTYAEDEKGELHPFTDVKDVRYNNWLNEPFNFAPVNTIFKLLNLVRILGRDPIEDDYGEAATPQTDEERESWERCEAEAKESFVPELWDNLSKESKRQLTFIKWLSHGIKAERRSEILKYRKTPSIFYAPGDEANRKKIEKAIIELLGEATPPEGLVSAVSTITRIGESTPLFVTTGKQRGAFGDTPNDNAFIVMSTKDLGEQLKGQLRDGGTKKKDETAPLPGQMSMEDFAELSVKTENHALAEEAYRLINSELPPEEQKLNLFLLQAFASGVEEARRQGKDPSKVTLSLYDFAEATGIDLRAAQSNEDAKAKLGRVLIKISELEDAKGIWKRDTIISAFSLDNVNLKEKTITYRSPWTEKLIEDRERPAELPKLDGPEAAKEPPKKTYNKKAYTDLVKMRLASAKNKATAEVVLYIIAAIVEHGTKKDGKRPGLKGCYIEDPDAIEWYINLEDLKDNVSEIWRILQREEPRRRNEGLKRVLYGRDWKPKTGKNKNQQEPLLLTYLKEYTELYSAYNELEIELPATPPTYKELNWCIRYKHKGKNASYSRKKTLQFSKAEASEEQPEEDKKDNDAGAASED